MSMTPFKSATYNSQSVNNLTQDEIDALDGAIPGLAVANKVLIPDDNVDLSGIVNLTAHCVVANWSALGCSGWNQTASFAHRDLNNQSQFAMLHSAFGEVRINATNSQNISLCINDLIEHLQVRGSTGEVIIGVASEVPSPAALLHLHGDRGHGLSMYADYPIEVAPTDDILCKFGKASVGYLGSGGFTGFSHNAMANATSFAIQQSLTGTTIVNAAAGENLWLSTGGFPVVALDMAGNFGVGNLAPTEKLDVAGNVKVSGTVVAGLDLDLTSKFGKVAIGSFAFNNWAGFAHIDRANSTDYALLQSDSGTTILNSTGPSGIVLKINDVEGARLAADGNFGININAPTEKLEVVGNAKLSGSVEAGKDASVVSFFGAAAVGYNTVNADWASFAHIDNNSGSKYALLQSPLGKTHLNSASGKSIEFLEAAVIKMTLLNGDLGIGTVAPSEKLEVVGNILASGTIVSSDDRLKHNEVNIITGLDIIRQLVPQTYDKTTEMRDEDYNGVIDTEYRKESGFIAQEIAAISDLSYCVSGGDYEDSSGNLIPKPYNVNYNNIFTYGIAGIKELDAIVSAQAIIIQDLQTRLAALET